jgi:hypothetical protein
MTSFLSKYYFTIIQPVVSEQGVATPCSIESYKKNLSLHYSSTEAAVVVNLE